MINIANKLKTVDFAIGLFFIIIAGIYFTILMVNANLDLTEGRHVIFMDEQISYDEVNHILHPEGFVDFLKNITLAGDHRYGKIFYNISAFFSAVPSYVFGDKGQIIGTRLTQAIILMLAYLLISITFFRYWLTKSLAFSLLLSLPTTADYFAMPKPEAVQTLFLALFLWQAKKQNFEFGKHWFFMGMAFGAKISALPYVAFFALLAMFQNQIKRFDPIIKKSIKFFLLGLLIADIKIIQIKHYLGATFFSTTHGADDSTITVLSWVDYIYNSMSSTYVVILLFSVVFLFFSISVYKLNIEKMTRLKNILFKEKDYMILFFGTALLLITMLKIDRLWSHYLHLPFVLIVPGFLIFLERIIIYKYKTLNYFTVFLLVALCAISFLNNPVTQQYKALSERTKTTTYTNKIQEYNYLKSFLTKLSITNNQKLKVLYDPRVYLLNSSEQYEIIRFWGWFLRWQENADVVIFYPRHAENLKNQHLSKTNINYKQWQQAINLYNKFVVNDTKNIKNKQIAYIQLKNKNIPNNLRIYLRSNLYEKWLADSTR